MTTSTEETEERRRFARLDIPIRVQYKVGSRELGAVSKATTKNISAGGCLLMTSDELPLNSEIELDIFLGEGESEMLKLKGSIVRLNRSDKKNFEYGISFSGMSAGAKRLFADFCFAKMYELIGLSDWPTARRKE